MFEILSVKTFDGQEYKIEGNEKEVELSWKYPQAIGWDILYFHKLEGGIEACMKHLTEELNDLVIERRARERRDDFVIQAYNKCERLPSESW